MLAMYWNLIVSLIMMRPDVRAAVVASGKVACRLAGTERGCAGQLVIRGGEAAQEIELALTEARGPGPSESGTVLQLICDVRPL